VTDRTETAYAKLNLALHVRRREPDGYHAIETLFVFCEDGDRLELTDQPSLSVEGPFAVELGDAEDNLVLRAARGFAERFGGAPAGFRLDKRLPVAAGLGGGSADAAAALRLLCRRDGIPLDDPSVTMLARQLGADVPACLISRPVRGTDRGDVLTSLEGVPAGMAALLVNPLLPLSTAAVFRAWDGIDRGALAEGEAMTAARTGRNDLEQPARSLCPAIGTVLATMAAQPGVELVRMSGSGATCFGLFSDAASCEIAAESLRAAQPGWWVLPTRLR
jgi:4-diphosphocytidyl-2-C-methyl-D-erythritol kinase